MAFEWYDQIDRIVWHLEECVQQAAQKKNDMLGMAPSAGDEARARLRAVAAAKPPLELIAQVDGLSESDVQAVTQTIAVAAVDLAADRGSMHVTREDLAAAVHECGTYPYLPMDD
jgi:hypothetical protein